jgi:hypothetical protein
LFIQGYVTVANEFDYAVALSITHPAIDPSTISQSITEFRVKIETKAGSVRLSRKGEPIVPVRKAILSHWLAELHDARTLDSDIISLSQFLNEQLTRIEHHRELLLSVCEEGQVALCIDVFPKALCAATEIDPHTLALCARLGVSIELSVYCHDTKTV